MDAAARASTDKFIYLFLLMWSDSVQSGLKNSYFSYCFSLVDSKNSTLAIGLILFEIGPDTGRNTYIYI